MIGEGLAANAAEQAAWSLSTARLDDFRPLLPAEEEVVARLGGGDFDRLGDGLRPDKPDSSRVVRAPFLRFLFLGGEDGCRPHEKGVRISGAWIKDVLDLEACLVFRDIGLKDCHFESAPVLRAAIINRLFLDGSKLPGLRAERIEVRGGVYLRSAEIDGEVAIFQSRLGGNLECDGAIIRSAEEHALNANSIEVHTILARGASFHGGVALSGARLAADLDFSGATVSNPEGVAIDATEIEDRGSVLLRNARIDGEVRLMASGIGGDLDCTGAVVVNPGRAALDISRAAIKGAFFLRSGAKLDGMLAMTGASIGTIHDEEACWPKRGDLLLNRCLYEAFIDAPVDAESRLRWLALQTPKRWGADFWPQPYEQLATVFRAMGHDEDARAVLVVKEYLQRRARRSRAQNPLWRAYLWAWDGLLAVTVRYGRQPLIAFLWLGLFWLIGVAVFGYAERVGALKPNNPIILRSPEWILCGVNKSEQRFLIVTQQIANGAAGDGQNQLDCFRERWETSSYPEFNRWVYSLDTLLPVLAMGQKAYWRPNPQVPGGRFTITYYYFQSIIGWILSLLAITGFSGLVKSS